MPQHWPTSASRWASSSQAEQFRGDHGGEQFNARERLTVRELAYEVFRLDRVDSAARLPYSLKVLLENLLCNEDGALVTADRSTRSAPGIRRPRAAPRFSSRLRGCCCRTSPAPERALGGGQGCVTPRASTQASATCCTGGRVSGPRCAAQHRGLAEQHRVVATAVDAAPLAGVRQSWAGWSWQATAAPRRVR